MLVIGKRPDGSVLLIIAENGSTIGNQVLWLFGLGTVGQPDFSVRSELETLQDRVEFPARFILEQIGVVVEAPADNYLDVMLRKFKGKFPPTRKFSEYARSTLPHVSASDDADEVLMAWMEREETLFRELERHLIADRLAEGFETDVNGFLSYSLSVQNRRKSRVGAALENHLERIFQQRGIKYTRGAISENRSKPDFLFPGVTEYHDPSFPKICLNMLGVKSTCKDRWRQVLAEASRIKKKHLFTLEAAISANQTKQMKTAFLSLVIPKKLHSSYSPSQQTWLLDLSGFIKIIESKSAP
jgi:hypothetical protein